MQPVVMAAVALPPRSRPDRSVAPPTWLSHLLESSIYVTELLLRDTQLSVLGLPGSAVLLLFLKGGSTSPTPTLMATTSHQTTAWTATSVPGDTSQRGRCVARASHCRDSVDRKPDHLAGRWHRPLSPRSARQPGGARDARIPAELAEHARVSKRRRSPFYDLRIRMFPCR